MIKKTVIWLMAIIVIFSFAKLSFAANTDSHTVTVTVGTVNEIAITGGGLILTIDSVDFTATDSTCSLDWATNQTSKKVTVATTVGVPPQLFGLTVEATGIVGGGASSGVVTLSHGAAAQDLMTGISEEIGGCTLLYEASAAPDQGTGTDVHTVTYTLTDV